MSFLRAFDPLTLREQDAVLDTARALLHQAEAGGQLGLLRGRQFGLLCESDSDGDAALFRQALAGLGAQVAHILPGRLALGTLQDIQRTAEMLGRLYDTLACEGLDAALVRQLATYAGVPVYDGLAAAPQEVACLLERLAVDASETDKRCVILQALLLGSSA